MMQGSNDIVSNYLCDIYNNSKSNESYPSSLKIGAVTPVNNKNTPTLLKKGQRPVSLIPLYPSYLKGRCTMKSMYIWKHSSLLTYLVIEKNIVQSNV